MTVSHTAWKPAAPPTAPVSAGNSKGRKPRSVQGRRWRNVVWVLPAVLLLGVFAYLPLVQNLGFSFLKWDIYSGRQTFVGADNYVRMFNDPIFWKSLLNNSLYAV